jgi:NitT/TauT family transport system substrate-binding protein
MKNRKILLIKSICACVSLFILAGCTAAENSGDTKEVRIAYFPNITHVQALAGIQSGAFEKAFGDEINVTFTAFNAGPAEIEAIFANQIDIGYIGPIPAINGYARSGGDIKIISNATNGGAVFVTRNGAEIDTVAALDGKKIAVPQFGNTQHLILLKILSDNNLKTIDKGGTVSVVEAANADIKTLFDKGDIDAALVPEPWGTRLINEVGANVLLDYDQLMSGGDYSTALVIVSADFLENNRGLVETFMRVHKEMTAYVINSPDEAMTAANAEIEKQTGSKLSEGDLKSSFERMTVTDEISADSVKAYMDIYVAEEFVGEIKDPDGIFDFSVQVAQVTAESQQD